MTTMKKYLSIAILTILYMNSVWSQSLIKVVDINETIHHFGEMRSYRPEHAAAKDRARAYVKETFEELALGFHTTLEEHHFETTYQENNYTGLNFMWILPGTRYQQPGDKFMMVGAHYDSQVRTPGVGDDGSGMTAMIETARALVKGKFSDGCEFRNSIGFVAFDWEEFALRGSERFVYDYFVPIVLKQLNIAPADFEGIVVLDTVLNWDPTPNSMMIPVGFDLVFPEEYKIVEADEFRGNFLIATNRVDDAAIGIGIRNIWDRLPEADKYKLIYLEMPLEGRPVRQPLKWLALKDLTRSDHQSFWNYADKDFRAGLKGIFLTDGANFRGRMVQCYHRECDSLTESLNEDVLMWLAKITETLTRYFLEITTEKQDVECTGWADHWSFEEPSTGSATSHGASSALPVISIIAFCLQLVKRF